MIQPVVVVGMFLDDPPSTAVAGTCEICQIGIVIGPDSQKILAERPDAITLCMTCAVEYVPREPAPMIRQAKHYRP